MSEVGVLGELDEHFAVEVNKLRGLSLMNQPLRIVQPSQEVAYGMGEVNELGELHNSCVQRYVMLPPTVYQI